MKVGGCQALGIMFGQLISCLHAASTKRRECTYAIRAMLSVVVVRPAVT